MDKEELEKLVNKGWSQREIAKIMGLSHTTVRHWLKKYSLKTKKSRNNERFVDCLECGEKTKNPKFCSRSCSAAYHNRIIPKRKKKKYFCSDCGVEIGYRRKFCGSCQNKSKYGANPTLGDVIYLNSNRSNAYTYVRYKAREILKVEPNVCEHCRYDRHVEVCHIIAISEFDESTKLSVINDRENLKLLCPNCHWEFDHP